MDCSCHFARVDQKSTSKCSNVLARTFIKHGTLMLGDILFYTRICVLLQIHQGLGGHSKEEGPQMAGQIAWTHILLL